MNPNFLYHGTGSRALGTILSGGLKPRGRKKGNWESFPSRPDMVYLTTAYAPYFAINSSKKGDKALILEIDFSKLEISKLYPDEDFIAQVLSVQEDRPLDEVHEEVCEDLEGYQHCLSDSLGGLGNCSYKGVVPAVAISRYVLLDCESRSDLAMMAMDPCISLMNYKFCGNRYRSVISWLFGDREDFEIGIGDNRSYIELLERSQPGYGKRIQDVFDNRSGIEVVTCPARAA
jgi:hypothetical protein